MSERVCPKWTPPIRLWRRWNESGRIPFWARLIWPTLHFCGDFDGLLIDRTMGEWECCTCG